jgi:hypothetical protein
MSIAHKGVSTHIEPTIKMLVTPQSDKMDS